MEEMFEARIGRYLSGEMTGIEKKAFEQELITDQSLNDQFLVLQKLWQNANSEIASDWDVHAAFQRFTNLKEPVQPESKRVFQSYRIYWAAAAVILVLFGAYTVFNKTGSPVTYAYSEGAIEPIVLKDGSKIFLNKGSDVTIYPFTKKKRHVKLEGEAFFEISPDAKRPFTIVSGSALTEVVGTSFNLVEADGQTSIFVKSGKVIFSSVKDTKVAVALTEGEAATFENEKMQLIANPSPNINSWLTQQLRFGKKMPLTDVITDVSHYFDKEIIIENEAIKSCRISISLPFKNPEISSVLKAVAGTVNAILIQEGDKYIIRGGDKCLD